MVGSYGWPMFGMGANSAGWPNIAVPSTGNYVSQSNLADIYANGRISLPNFGTVGSTSSANAFNPLAALGSPVNMGSNNPLGSLPSVNGLEYMSMISSGITMNLLGSANSLMDSITKSGALDPKNYTQWTPASWGLAPGTAGPGGSSGQAPNAAGFVAPLDKQYIKKPGSGGDFGPRNAPTAGASTDHKGDDFGAPAGSKIYAAKGGKITVKPNNGGAGNTVIVDHGNGLVTKYFHMSRFATGPDGKPLKTGDTVAQGQVIGYVGTTGTSTGNHLHFEVHLNGTAVDPWPYLSSLA